eukprot:2240386-Ditylum_brightwellii.AAC.1
MQNFQDQMFNQLTAGNNTKSDSATVDNTEQERMNTPVNQQNITVSILPCFVRCTICNHHGSTVSDTSRRRYTAERPHPKTAGLSHQKYADNGTK